MSNTHIITKNIGNLRGFSTDSSFLRPPNVAERAINIQKAPDGTLQLRRGFQVQIEEIGGLGIATVDNPITDSTRTLCVDFDGFLYNKLERQIFFYYDAQITGAITGITNANPGVVTSVGHGLITGVQVIFRDIEGMGTLNGKVATITVIDVDHFSIDIDTSNTLNYPPYTSGGLWSIYFADGRNLNFSIYVDPELIYQTANQSINCDITANRAAQTTNVVQNNVTTVNVLFGHDVRVGDVIKFQDVNGVAQQRTVTAKTTTSISFLEAASFASNSFISQFFTFSFGKGFDVAVPYTLTDFINALTDPSTGVFGLQVAINGDSSLPAAFLQILEPVIIDSNSKLQLDYWYWERVNTTNTQPFPKIANIRYQNSDDFENASFAVYDDILYITDGLDYVQKYDGQNVYRAGMTFGARPTEQDDNTFLSKPFSMGNVYQYGITYTQKDHLGHIVEGEISVIDTHTVASNTQDIKVTVNNLLNSAATQTTLQSNWNTGCALPNNQTCSTYGPDANGFYYDFVDVASGYTLKIDDTAYYPNINCATISAIVSDVFNIPVSANHGVQPGDTVYFFDVTNVYRMRRVVSVTNTSIQIDGDPVDVTTVNPNILVYKESPVFYAVAIVDGTQTDVTTIQVAAGYNIQTGDTVVFVDAFGDIQSREATVVDPTHISISGIPVSINNGTLISSETAHATQITLQKTYSQSIKFDTTSDFKLQNVISNNLRINIYRTKEGKTFTPEIGEILLVASIPNNSISGTTQDFYDGLPDDELGGQLASQISPPSPPPLCKYLLCYGNQLFYAGGERGNPENSDTVSYSLGNQPEAVPNTGTNTFNVPNLDDDITGIGIAGTTLIVTKTHSLWAITGQFLLNQIQVVQVAPGTNIGCIAHATIRSVGGLMYFLHTNGVYSISENQLFPTDAFGNPAALTVVIQSLFRETAFLPQNRFVLKRATAINYTKDMQYLLFLPCEDQQSQIRSANSNSIVLCYDYEHKNWFLWNNINAAGGFLVIDDDLYWQERRTSTFDAGAPSANLYKQHRFYRLVDHADHAGPQYCEWRSSWEDLGQPEVRKKFSHCVLLLDRLSQLQQFNNLEMTFFSYVNRIPNLPSTISNITQTNETRNASWGSPWGWNMWSGYQDSFVTINLKGGTVAKSMQVGIKIQGINMDMRLAGFQLECIPENRITVQR